MAVKDLGTKRTCQNCEAKFYDLKKKTPVCPKCDTEYVVAKPRARRAAAKVVEAPKPKEAPANDDAPSSEEKALKEIEVEVEEVEDDADTSLMEDTSDIDGDKDDVAEVMENIDTSADKKET